MKKISTNKSTIVVIVSILGLFWGISACNQSTLPETIEENQNLQSETTGTIVENQNLQSETTETLSIKKESVEKKYSFVDASNVEYTLIISGKKARLETKGGSTNYATYHNYNYGGYEWAEVELTSPYPHITFASGSELIVCLYIPTSFSYVYKDKNSFEAENPNGRLDLTKIE